ncbi:hypothetical protein SETIT_1G186100v2 [Setaria italica]|uniref:Uncharacterized protein n=1 Tax=Setaria italica TaxID=4555 RepID=A0A368PM31_SETIT|nr:hypothetical protein SETIT_1G186100v2 [Setaria italica]
MHSNLLIFMEKMGLSFFKPVDFILQDIDFICLLIWWFSI